MRPGLPVCPSLSSRTTQGYYIVPAARPRIACVCVKKDARGDFDVYEYYAPADESITSNVAVVFEKDTRIHYYNIV